MLIATLGYKMINLLKKYILAARDDLDVWILAWEVLLQGIWSARGVLHSFLFKRTEDSFSFVIILVGKHVSYVYIDFYASKGKKFQLLSYLLH